MRGVGKYTMDLANAITQARSLSSQLVDKRVSLKKTIADLSFKEKKEFGAASGGSGNIDDYASNFLKNIVKERAIFNGDGSGYDGMIGDGDSDAMFAEIGSQLMDSTRSSDSDKYLKYEQRGVTLKVMMNPTDSDDYYYIAEASDGEILDDYPLPMSGKLKFNPSTMKATDSLGEKYDVEFTEIEIEDGEEITL